MNNFYVSVLPGLAQIAREELAARTGAKVEAILALRNSELLRVRYSDAKRLLELRTAEDVFVELGTIDLTGRPEDLKAVAKSSAFGGALIRALGVAQTLGRSAGARLRFRVVVQAEDARWRSYRRVDIQEAVEAAVVRGHGARLDRDSAPVELWIHQVKRSLVASLRISSGVSRAHGGREVERAAALRPSVAAAMVQLSEPSDEDVFLDPMCGTGTLLLERAMCGRYAMLIGGDIDAGAVAATLANFGPRHQPRRIERLDATALPFGDGSVNKIACNLPWGRQIGEKAMLPALYSGTLREAVRVLSSGGIMVLVTSEWDLLKSAIKQRRELTTVRTVRNVEILGRRADIFVVSRV